MCQTMLKQTILLLLLPELFICILCLLIANILLYYLEFVQGYLNFMSLDDSSRFVNKNRIVTLNEWLMTIRQYVPVLGLFKIVN